MRSWRGSAARAVYAAFREALRASSSARSLRRASSWQGPVRWYDLTGVEMIRRLYASMSTDALCM